MTYKKSFSVGTDKISLESPVFFVADIAANHDGSLQRAKDLIRLAKDAGANAAKFQHFQASKIVSDRGFRDLGGSFSHQEKWGKPVYEVYKDYSLNRDWNGVLAETARDAGIHFMTTPYDVEAVDEIDPLVPAYKIGSGDITWHSFIEYVAAKEKPVLIAAGASSMADVELAVAAALSRNDRVCLMQCNTNYTASVENFRHVNLRVLQTFSHRWPGLPLGLSDHTPGHATTLGAVALGARIIEKHFTDDTTRPGPDHLFSMTPATWREMVDRTRELENALGDGVKRVEDNEIETVVLQRRCVRAAADLTVGHRLIAADMDVLRPAPVGSLSPSSLQAVAGQRIRVAKSAGEALFPGDLEGQADA